MSSAIQYITILGSTGSIGVNTLRVIAEHPQRYRIFALTANTSADVLFTQCVQFTPQYAVLADEQAAEALGRKLKAAGVSTEVLHGVDALALVASAAEVDTVMAAIVGGAGLPPTLAAAKSGKKVLLANKEALVMAGDLFLEIAAENHAKILPIDSEHNAIFQCLPVNSQARFDHCPKAGFSKIVLTASGGPFLDTPLADLMQVTPQQACKHPNWKMGQKISVDSATLVNKALELIEASYLFATPSRDIDIVIHPQSIVHSMVYFTDGSVLAQLGNPDMRTPIAYGLAWPERISSGVSQLDLTALGRLDFLPPDTSRFPGLELGRTVAESRGTAPVIFNAANEIAVAAFLTGQAGFTQIPVIIDAVLQKLGSGTIDCLEHVMETDKLARRVAIECLH
ncbi:MAG: 1-deoxy-D-xylulose-5-phosphate reductoisomerase [Pseudomonadota bacterium]